MTSALAEVLEKLERATPLDDVVKAIKVLMVLHESSAADITNAGNEALANIHLDAVKLLEYTLELHIQNITDHSPNRVMDELRSLLDDANEFEAARIPSSKVGEYIAAKSDWKDRCGSFIREHGPALLASQQYAQANPLGGPASMLETAARRIRAGEDFHEVLADYDLHSGPALLRDAGDAARYRWLRSGGYEHADDGLPHIVVTRQGSWGNWHEAIIEDDEADAAIDAAMHAPGGAGGGDHG